MEAITREEMGRRVPVPPYADEVQRLAVTMNEMLSRLEESNLKQQAFVADAAHELRSPLASLRAQLEIAVAHPQSVTTRELAEEALEDTGRLQALAIDLLQSARIDAGRQTPLEAIDVGERVRDLLSGRHGDRVPIVYEQPPEPVVARVSVQTIDQVVTNLVDNAVRHAQTQVDVQVALDPDQQTSGFVKISVADDGPGIQEVDRERSFERFVRLDEARGREDGGTGLGLAIARELARSQGGEVNVVDAAGGARFLFTLPIR